MEDDWLMGSILESFNSRILIQVGDRYYIVAEYLYQFGMARWTPYIFIFTGNVTLHTLLDGTGDVPRHLPATN